MATVKSLLASLETDFIEYKQAKYKENTELKTTVSEKEKEIDFLKNEISSLKLDYSKAQEFSKNVSIKQSNLEDLKKT